MNNKKLKKIIKCYNKDIELIIEPIYQYERIES
jgi:hypothetical protein